MNPWFIPFSEPRVTQNQPRAKALWCLGRGSTRVHEMPFRRPEAQAPSVPSRSCLSELPNRKKTEKTPATEKDELKNMARASRPLKKTKAHQKGGILEENDWHGQLFSAGFFREPTEKPLGALHFELCLAMQSHPSMATQTQQLSAGPPKSPQSRVSAKNRQSHISTTCGSK